MAVCLAFFTALALSRHLGRAFGDRSLWGQGSTSSSARSAIGRPTPACQRRLSDGRIDGLLHEPLVEHRMELRRADSHLDPLHSGQQHLHLALSKPRGEAPRVLPLPVALTRLMSLGAEYPAPRHLQQAPAFRYFLGAKEAFRCHEVAIQTEPARRVRTEGLLPVSQEVGAARLALNEHGSATVPPDCVGVLAVSSGRAQLLEDHGTSGSASQPLPSSLHQLAVSHAACSQWAVRRCTRPPRARNWSTVSPE